VVRKTEVRPGQDMAHEEVMAVQPGTADRTPPAAAGRDAGHVLRVLALIAVAIGLAALTAAACVLSYSSIHHLATQAGVSPRLARLYPLIFDALLVVAGCCVLALRGAGLVSRVYSWLCLLVLLGGLAAGGAVRAAAVKVPHRLGGILAAVIPWALVLIGFGLLLALLRYVRIRRVAQQLAGPEPADSADQAAPAELVVIENTAAPAASAGDPAAIVPGFARTPTAPGLGTPGVLPAVTHTGGSADVPTAPQPVVPVEAAPVEAAPVEATPVEAAPVKPAPAAHAPVRQADLQLKARVPRQPPGQQAQASPVTARHAPFMPPVGPPPTAEAPADAGAAPDEAAGAGPATPTDQPGSTQQTNPRPPAGQPAGPGTTAADETAAREATANEPVITPVTPTTLNAAPVNDDEDAEPGEPPALRRPRSSPTPPEE
jgi:uncharacterized protein DUF2637